MSADLAQLSATIQALEGQRALLGDAIVDTALAPLRAQLQALQAAAAAPEAPAQAPRQSLRQVTILFLDVVGSTTLSTRLDPEETHAVMDGALSRCTTLVQVAGGKVLQYAGDNLLAVFGADVAHEDDAERAVHCGLALLAEGRLLGAEVLRDHGHDGFDVRVGLHTGPVLLGGGVDAEGSIRGLSVNVAARMEQTAPPGALRISHDTYRQVRGVFDVEAQAPMFVKGVDEPVLTYLVQRAKPRAFRAGTRGIEGIETRMIGREGQLLALQQTFQAVLTERRLYCVSVVADAGVGKSRLLYEFGNWAEARPERFYLLQGRAHPQTQQQAFGLLRDVLAWRLAIADSDSMALAKDKIERGIVPLFLADDGPELAQAHAHILGHLIGLDFSDSPHLRGILDDPKQIRSRGFHAAAQAFRRMSAAEDQPILLQLDDLHWADDGSLDFLAHLVRVAADVPILMVVLTRPTLFERRDDWTAAAAQTRRIDLAPLDKSTSGALVHELLKKLPEVPAALSELIISRAEGNPYYMEELVKMLIDQGALQPGDEHWSLNPARLMSAAVPATLTGVLQARLDGLPPPERRALQQASVIGLVFWDQALAAVDSHAPQALPALERRELALPRSDGRLANTREYAFRHQFLQEVTYDTLLKPDRRLVHARTAAWMASLSGARAASFLGPAAEHYEKAGDARNACEYFTRAAEQARARFAHEAALAYVARGLALLPEQPDDAALLRRWRLLDVRERSCDLQGRRPEQRADLAALQELADALHDDRRRAELATRRCLLAVRTGDFKAQEAEARAAIVLAQRAGADEMRLNAQRLLASALARQGDAEAARTLVDEALVEARARGLRDVESRLYNALSVIAARQQDMVALLESSQRATTLRRELGDRRNEAIGLSSLGSGWLELGQFEQAQRDLNEALRLHRAVGDRALEPIALANLSQLALWQGQAALARKQAQAALDTAVAVQARDVESLALWCLGHAALAQGEPEPAAQAFERALTVTAGNGSALRHDATAGLARVALAEGRLPQALAQVEALLQHQAAGGSLDGTVGQRLIQLTCWQVLQAVGDSRAPQVLAQAHASLQAHTANIKDPALRDSALNRVPENRALCEAWAAQAPA